MYDFASRENETLRPRDADRISRSLTSHTIKQTYSTQTFETRPGHHFGRVRVQPESNNESLPLQPRLQIGLPQKTECGGCGGTCSKCEEAAGDRGLKADLGATDAGVTPADASPPRDAGPGPRDAAPPVDAAPPAPSCTYAITYTNPVVSQCASTAPCGARVLYEVTKVTATGSGCPASLRGLKLTEVVTNNHGCVPDSPQAGPGCDIETPDRTQPRIGHPVLNPGGRKCQDSYALCLGLNEVPAQGCTEVVTQKFYVGGILADTKTITFRAPKANGRCTPGTVTRT